MAKDVVAEVPAAKDLFDRASDILGYDLLQVCVEGTCHRRPSSRAAGGSQGSVQRGALSSRARGGV